MTSGTWPGGFRWRATGVLGGVPIASGERPGGFPSDGDLASTTWGGFDFRSHVALWAGWEEAGMRGRENREKNVGCCEPMSDLFFFL